MASTLMRVASSTCFPPAGILPGALVSLPVRHRLHQPIRWAMELARTSMRPEAEQRCPPKPGDENVDLDETCALRRHCSQHRRYSVGCDQETENDSPSQRLTRSDVRSAPSPACRPLHSCSHRRWYPWLQSHARALLTKKGGFRARSRQARSRWPGTIRIRQHASVTPAKPAIAVARDQVVDRVADRARDDVEHPRPLPVRKLARNA